MEKSTFTRDYRLFLELLRVTREKAGVTQVELAERLGESQSWVSKVERGIRRVDVVELRLFCKALNIQPSEFMQRLDDRLAGRRRP